MSKEETNYSPVVNHYINYLVKNFDIEEYSIITVTSDNYDSLSPVFMESFKTLNHSDECDYSINELKSLIKDNSDNLMILISEHKYVGFTDKHYFYFKEVDKRIKIFTTLNTSNLDNLEYKSFLKEIEIYTIFSIINSHCYYEYYLNNDCIYFETDILYTIFKKKFSRKLQLKINTGIYPELFTNDGQTINTAFNVTVKLYYKNNLLSNFFKPIEISDGLTEQQGTRGLLVSAIYSITPFQHSAEEYESIHVTPEFTPEYVNDYYNKYAIVLKMIKI